ncbi:ABC transporter ATP-binding protein [Micromonospora sp. KC723]|nr:ABC transporter ATP-binding protein [Micromonospora sp. KC723]
MRVAGVTVALGGRDVLRGVDLRVDAGRFVGLVGPNGSGKSTLIRAAYRALRPRVGAVWIGGDDVWRIPARESARRSAVVAQHDTEAAGFTVAEVVAMGRTPHKGAFTADGPADREVCRLALRRVGLTGLAGRPVAALSGGERRRVAVARALAQQAPVLLLDEPTNHLDVRHQYDLLALVRSLGLTVLAALHDLDLAVQFCDEVYVLRDGTVAAAGPPARALDPAVVREVFGVDAHLVTHPVTGAPRLLLSAAGRQVERRTTVEPPGR